MSKIITALTVQKRDQHRVNVYLDGEFAFGLSRIVAAWLKIGQELTDEKIISLKAEDEEEVAYQRAIRFIGYRTRSVSEVKKSLLKGDISEAIIESILARLERNNLLDDKQFAQTWVENRNEFRPRSHRMLSFELRNKGIDPKIIDQVLEETTPDEDLAYLAAQKQIRRYRHLDWKDFRRKLGSFLARRGFSYATINPIVNQIWAELDSESEIGIYKIEDL